MPNLIISPYAISFNSIKNALESYINDKSVSEVLDTWKDFYTAGAGQTVLELDAAIAAFYAFHFIIGRREAYLPLAQNYSSILGGAQSLGYNASRGHNLHMSMIIKPNVTQALTRWTVLGSYAEYDIILWGEVIRDEEGNITEISDKVILNENTPIEICCIIGNSQTQSIAINSNRVQQFIFTADNTTDDCRLILTNTEIPYSTQLKDAMNDNYIMLSNSYGSVDVFYLNNGNYKYTTGDTLYLQYIQRNNLTYNNISTDNIVLDYGDIISTSVISEREDVQSADSIKLAASIYHETNNIVRARGDYAKLLMDNKSLGLCDANDLDINPGLMALTYLRENRMLMTDLEKDAFYKQIEQASPDGVLEAFIIDPVPIAKTLNITLWQKSDEIIPGNIDTLIKEVLSKYNNTLGAEIDFEKLENELEQITGVQIARIDVDTQEYSTNTSYKPYDIIQIEDEENQEKIRFICSNVETRSNIYEPNWSAASEIGDKVFDNNLVWENSDAYINSVPFKWKSNKLFNLYDDVAVGYDIYPNSTTSTEPIWGTTIITDGNVTFNRIKKYDYILAQWEPNTSYDLDEYVEIINGNERAVYKVAQLLGKSSNSEPDWSSATNINETVSDNALTWTLFYNSFDPEKTYIADDEFAKVINGKIYVYKCISTCSPSTIYWSDDGNHFKYSSKDPFDGTNELYEMELRTQVETVQQNGEWVQQAIQVPTKTNLLWELEEVIDTLGEWQASTEINLNTYIQKDNKFFKVTDVSNAVTGDEFDTTWPDTFIDNNIVWEIDTCTINLNTVNVSGTTWVAEDDYELDEIILVKDNDSHYAYNVVYTNSSLIRTDSQIYSVVNYCGTTGSEPQWTYEELENGETVIKYYNTVMDNDILWTKTVNTSEDSYSEYTRFERGKIIKVDNEYYMFTGIIGKSGNLTPNWYNLRSGSVKDNNLNWMKLPKSTKITLKWNEYFELTHNLVGIN